MAAVGVDPGSSTTLKAAFPTQAKRLAPAQASVRGGRSCLVVDLEGPEHPKTYGGAAATRRRPHDGGAGTRPDLEPAVLPRGCRNLVQRVVGHRSRFMTGTI